MMRYNKHFLTILLGSIFFTQPLLASSKTTKNSSLKNHLALSQKLETETKKNKTVNKILKQPLLEENPYYPSYFIGWGLEYPFNVGVHLKSFMAENLYARLGLGFMPSLLMNFFDNIPPIIGYLNPEESILLSDIFNNAFYIDFRLAWFWQRTTKKNREGFYAEWGLSSSLIGRGEFKGSHLNQVVTNLQTDTSKMYSLKTTTINTSFHVGYQLPWNKISFNFEMGLIKILALHISSITTLEAPHLLSEAQKKKMKRFLKQNGWIFPTVSVGVSFSF